VGQEVLDLNGFGIPGVAHSEEGEQADATRSY
jgi:hypothetical protein